MNDSIELAEGLNAVSEDPATQAIFGSLGRYVFERFPGLTFLECNVLQQALELKRIREASRVLNQSKSQTAARLLKLQSLKSEIQKFRLPISSHFGHSSNWNAFQLSQSIQCSLSN